MLLSEEVALSGPLILDRDAMAELCRKHGVGRLVVFGSAVTDQFDDARSHVDFVVEFDSPVGGPLEAYFGLKEDLEALLGCPVDLSTPAALENPYFAASVTRSGREVYTASADAPEHEGVP